MPRLPTNPSAKHLPVEERWEMFFDLLAHGLLPYTAARRAGLSIDQLQYRRKNDPEQRRKEDEAIEIYAEHIEQYIIDVANGNEKPDKDRLQAAHSWLKVRNRRVWDAPKETTVNHNHRLELATGADILALQAKLQDRQPRFALPAGDDPDIIDAEVIEDELTIDDPST